MRYAVDLGAGRRLVLTHYALQHGGHRKGRRLRNWVLEASNAPHALDGAAALEQVGRSNDVAHKDLVS